MLSGLKFIPRDQVNKAEDETSDDSRKKQRKSGHRNKKGSRKSKHSHFSSSGDESLERIKSASKNKEKWYDSDEDLSLSEKSDSLSESDHDRRKSRSQKGKRRRHNASSDSERKSRSKKKEIVQRKDYSSENDSMNGSERENAIDVHMHHRGEMRRRKEDQNLDKDDDNVVSDMIDDSSQSQSYNIVRKEMGLEWMLRPKDNVQNVYSRSLHIEPEEPPAEVIKKGNPREMNPYLKDNGSGYPEELDELKAGNKILLATSVVGDGGASWRLKALKRAQEHAAREGRSLEEVVEERWGSMGHFAASVASRNVASTHAHIQAIKERRKGLVGTSADVDNDGTEKKITKNVLSRHPKMRVPKVRDTLSWGKRGSKNLSTEDNALVSAAMSNLNKFSSDGSFMDKFIHKKDKSDNSSNSSYQKSEVREEPKSIGFAPEGNEDNETMKPVMSANQLAAKALQLRMKGKHEEAEKLLKEAENIKTGQDISNESSKLQIDGTTSRFIMHDISSRQKNKEDDADLHLAQKIMDNSRYSISNQADDEYDYGDGPRRKIKKKEGGGSHKSSEITKSANRFLTQQDRCRFCFENPSRPKHLVIAIANFTYLSLPQQQPVVPGHCGIITLQHESSTRTVDDHVWDEIRNFKKCLIMMFAEQEKDVVFLETVMGLTQQRRHCMVECIPLPRDVSKQAPVYFKKAIDEAEDEWSQHNAKKLIDTSQKGLRGSIPKNFPYFHVEFGLNKGFVHVIDNERDFKSSFGLNVVRGMLRLPAEDMHRRGRYESMDKQKQDVANFARDWEPFDWTKQL